MNNEDRIKELEAEVLEWKVRFADRSFELEAEVAEQRSALFDSMMMLPLSPQFQSIRDRISGVLRKDTTLQSPSSAKDTPDSITPEDEKAIDDAATEYATFADNDNNDYSYSEDEHHTFTQGANFGVRYARLSSPVSVDINRENQFKIGGTNENYGMFSQYSTAIFNEIGNCVGRSFGNSYEESVSIAKSFAKASSPKQNEK